MKRRARPLGKLSLKPLALAVAALLGSAAPVHAQSQYYTYSGVVMTSPTDVFPIDASNAALDLRPNQLFVGVGTLGSFSALAGASLQANGLVLGTSGGGNGNFSLTGNGANASALVRLRGGGTRLDVGSWGSGSLTVSQGGVFDAAVDVSTCVSANGCYNTIGNAAGSTGTVTVTGAGSELRLIGGTTIGQTSINTTTIAGSVVDFGTPGGTTNAFVNVLAGGTLRTQNAAVAFNNATLSGFFSNGAEKANGTVVVSGSGSQWLVSRQSVNNTAALVSIGSGAGSDGLVTVSAGGKLHVDGALVVDGSASSGPNDGINVGSTGKGKLVVTGAGSQVLSTGVNPFINVGANNSLGNGSFEVLAGASASTLYLNVGRNGGTGTMLIDGTNSTLTQSGVGTNQSVGANGAAFAHIGRNTGGGGGTGSVTVSGGGSWIINDGGGDGRTAQGSPGIALGRGAGSNGTLTITGAGSKVQITSTSLNPGAGSGDNYNPFVGVGYDNPGSSSGTLLVSAGGQLLLTGNALSTQADPRATSLQIGGRGDALPATGTATVTGAGSKISVTGSDSLISVGRGVLSGQQGNGTLNVLDQSLVESTSIVVGAYGIGTMNVDNASVSLTGYRTDSNPLVGAGMTVGRGAGGSGTLNMSNGASLAITPTLYTAGMAIGGDSFAAGGTGTVTLSGGSSIVIGGTLANSLSVGRSGNGALALSGGSFVDVGLGNLHVAGSPVSGQSTGVGSLTLASGSKATANNVNIGGNSDADIGGTGTASVSGASSELTASGASGFIGVGRNGTGTLTLSDQAKLSAIAVAVGRGSSGVGTLVASNATLELSGQQTTGSQSGATIGIGSGGGVGSATLNNSTLSITNLDSAGATLNVGGSGLYPGGTGTLTMVNSQITVNANAGQGTVSIGRTGSGTALLNNSSITNAGGNLYVARETGSTGTLALSNDSTVAANFVGIGVSAPGVGNAIGAAGGTGKLVLNDSTISTTRFELGAGSLLTGNNGTIDAGVNGPVVIAGTISPGNSPGRLRIRCDITMLFGSQLILDIDDTGVGFDIDQLIIGNDSKFDLAAMQIVFNFMGTTNPDAFAQTPGGFNLDKFLRAEGDGNTTQGLSTLFARNGYENWDDVLNPANFSATSKYYDVTDFSLGPNGEVRFVASATIPEPGSMALVLLALLAMAVQARRRSARRA